jgi:purine-binding chemotaxis protein CheW
MKDTMPDRREERMEAVWRSRAAQFSKPLALAGAGHDALPVLVLGIGEERFGIDLSDVTEVLPPTQVTPVPGVSPVFAGVINVHGEIRPVIDLTRLLGMEPDLNNARPRVILLHWKRRVMGLQITSVEQIRRIRSAELESTRNGHAELSKYIKGSTKDLLMLLNTETLFAELPQEGTT